MTFVWMRRHSAPLAFATLFLFWNTVLQASLAKAQSLPVSTEAAATPAASQPAASAEYDADTRGTLSQQLASQAAATPPTSAEAKATPAELANVDRALAALPSGGGVSPQAVALPSGATTALGMGESFTMQLSTGSSGYTVPLALPAARGMVQPQLQLAYATSAGFGLAGVGWQLTTTAISRQTDRGTPRYDDRATWHPDQDRFMYGGQELVPICTVSAGLVCAAALPYSEGMPAWSTGWQYFRARVEGSFLRFFWSPDHQTWRIQSKVGTNLELGRPLDDTGYTGALERNPEDAKQVFRWYLVRQYDSQGGANTSSGPIRPVNLITYRYSSSQGVNYLTDIFDTSPAADPTTTDLSQYAHHTAISYEARPDIATSYRAGYAAEYSLRAKGIDVTSKSWSGLGNRELVRRYHLSYAPNEHRSRLIAVQMEGRCAAAVPENASQTLPITSCPRLPPMRFEYQRPTTAGAVSDAQGNAFDLMGSSVKALENSPPHSLDDPRVGLADINADGLPDVLVTAPDLFNGDHGVFFNGGSALGASGFAAASRMPVRATGAVADAGVLSLRSPAVTALDLDSDGIVNLLHMPQTKQYSIFSPRQASPGSPNYEWVGRTVSTASQQDSKIDFTRDAANVRVMDVNSDGLVDVVYSSATELQTFFALGRYPGGDGQFGNARWTGPETAEISNEPIRGCAAWSSTPVRFSDPETQLADMNGDGLADIVRVRSGQILYWPGRGNGFWGTGNRSDCNGAAFAANRDVVMYRSPQFGTVQAGRLLLGDVNGDGQADLIEVRAQGVDIYLNDNGMGFSERQTLRDTPFSPNDSNYVRVLDVDGSGTPDILWGSARDYRYIDLLGGRVPDLLTKVSNGIGKTVEFEYASPARLMQDAQAAGKPWSERAPITMPVLVRTTTRDNLHLVGRQTGAYQAEYSYRDPVYEGYQREFRGFREVTVKQVGDATHPTSFERTQFLLGECPRQYAAQGGDMDVCNEGQHWRDSWRDALKGLPTISETFDANNVYFSTKHQSYIARELYKGADGRRVLHTHAQLQDVFGYDTSNFDHAEYEVEASDVTGVNLNDLVVYLPQPIRVRATAGTVHLFTASLVDNIGNPVYSIKVGCFEGCEAPDDPIWVRSNFDRPAGDASGWLWRETGSYAWSERYPEYRHQAVNTYNARGDLEESYGVLSGTLPLDRFHAAGQPIAPNPPAQSQGAAAPVQILRVDHSYDAFGHAIFTRGPSGSCSSGAYDTQYATLPITANVYAGSLDSGTNCGSRLFSHQVTYDRGLDAVVTSTDARGQPSRYDYDGFGRVVASTTANPAAPGQLAPQPTFTASYTLPGDPAVNPYTVTVVRTQNGATASVASYNEAWIYKDGLDRTIAGLTEADPSAGDAGNWIVDGAVTYDAKGGVAREYTPWFYTGQPQDFLRQSVGLATPYSSQELDAFGRQVRSYGFDRSLESYKVYHALSVDQYDAADVLPTSHQNTYTTVISDGHGRGIKQIYRYREPGSQSISQRVTINEWMPTGELVKVTQQAPGVTDVVRWASYDSLGRMVLNVEPNTAKPFNADPSTPPSTFKAWRYAYDDAGRLVGTSDARGCGANYFYDAGGRAVAEDRSPCEAQQAAYSAPNLCTGDGTEVFNRYDVADGDTVVVNGQPFAVNTSLLWGHTASVSALSSKAIFRYDASGRQTAVAVKLQKPGVPASAPTSRYAPRWYARDWTYDAAQRITRMSTGTQTPQLLGADGTSEVRISYSLRGAVRQVNSSYGVLYAGETRLADGRVQEFRLGDASSVQRYFTYDAKLRVQDTQTYRGSVPLWSAPTGTGYSPPSAADDPTRQLLLEDTTLAYDEAGNITRVEDHRLPEEWPATAKPVTRQFVYDDLYRLTQVDYTYAGGAADAWKSPFARENANSSLPQPSPQVSFATRVTRETFRYDPLGNLTRTTDDQQAFWDRSTGDRSHGTATQGPNRLLAAGNRALAPTSPRRGDAEIGYDAAGNVTGIIGRRDGPCLPAGASCWQRFGYQWDEIGQLVQARRWDLSTAERTSSGQSLTQGVPARSADADLRYAYDADGQRTLKTAVDKLGLQRHTAYVFDSLELRSTTFDGTDYVQSAASASVVLAAAGVSARVIPRDPAMPATTGSGPHVLLQFRDYLGSASFSVDHKTGELVEDTRYMAYGAVESDYRPNRWQGFREPNKFTGKEEDIEVGLAYFGARYYSPYLGIWMSPDPATIHEMASDINPYAFVSGAPTQAVDPDGREVTLLVGLIIAVVVAAIVAAVTSAATQAVHGQTVHALGADGWLTAAGFGAVGGLVGGPIGGYVGGAIGGVWGGLVGGMVGGAVGSGASYGVGCGVGAYEYSGAGLATAVAGGALAGGVGGAAGAGVGQAFGAGWGAAAAGVAGGLTSYAINGATTGDWSALSLALSVGAAVAASTGAYAASTGGGNQRVNGTPSAQVATAQKAPVAQAVLEAHTSPIRPVVATLSETHAGTGPVVNAPPSGRSPSLSRVISEDSSGFTTTTVVRGGATGGIPFEFAGDVQRGSPGRVVLDKFTHGNAHASTKAQHLYEIYDIQTGDVVKTGISGQPLNKNGTSPRANQQLGPGLAARIVRINIPGRAAAKVAEQANTTRLHNEGNSLRYHQLPRP